MRTGTLKLIALSVVCLSLQIPWFCTEGLAKEWVVVDKVVDGDTMRLKDGTWVRFLGIDAPEIDHPSHQSQMMGYEALHYLAHLVNGHRIGIQTRHRNRDDYGRKLALVYTEKGEMINQTMIERGLASVLSFAPFSEHDELLLKAQRQAMLNKVGIWQKASLQTRIRLVGNQRSRRFHQADCPVSKKIHPKNLVGFCSSWQAFWAGYAPCRQCLGSKKKG